jgi:hypothetical protein
VTTLRELVESEGYAFVVDPQPDMRPDGLGDAHAHARARVCRDGLIACRADSLDCAYSAAHEIAEHRFGFGHTESMWAEQANILARWLKVVATTSPAREPPRPISNSPKRRRTPVPRAADPATRPAPTLKARSAGSSPARAPKAPGLPPPPAR